MSNIAICLQCEHSQKGCQGPCACTLSGKDLKEHYNSGDCPIGKLKAPMRGLGDLVAVATKAVGIQPCGGCGERQDALNRLVPFPIPKPL